MPGTNGTNVQTVRSLVLAAVLVLAVGLTAAAIATPQEPEADSPTERAARGKVTFRIYCQNCHGKDADGEGPIAELLRVRPADLTRLSEENGGQFPRERVYQVIDGRERVRGHGSSEMPVWGITFQDPSRDDQEEEARQRILDLVAHLESIQP